MDNLVAMLRELQAKLERFRKDGLKETPTRTIFIDPLLGALGWEVRDPDEVQLEYPTVDGKSVDYALKINQKPILLVEAKALNDPLTDVKDVTQTTGYAANDGIVWCILTNGVRWRVYRSVEQCPAPEKLMFEVSYAPGEMEGMSLESVAEQFRRFSRDAMAKGTLDAMGEQTFTDGKIRKALRQLIANPPKVLLKAVRRQRGVLAAARNQGEPGKSPVTAVVGGTSSTHATGDGREAVSQSSRRAEGRRHATREGPR